MPKNVGQNIREVWDYRLSHATPLIDRSSGTWVAQVWAKNNPDFDPANPETFSKPLAEFDTGIPAEKGDAHDARKIAKCYEWFKSVRDEFARDDIEEIKPIVRDINEATAKLAARGAI